MEGGNKRGEHREHMWERWEGLDGTESWENVIGFIEPVQTNKITF